MEKLVTVGHTEKLDHLWVELTQKCNLGCMHCYAESDVSHSLHGLMNLKSWKNVILDAFLEGCKSIQFAGGEPTINPNLSDLICFSKQLGYEIIEIHTNAVNISDKLFQIIKENQVEIGISIYSYRPEIHDAITKLNGSFYKTLNNIQKFLQNKIPLRISIVRMAENKHDIEKTFEFIKNKGVVNIGIDNIRPVGRGRKDNSYEEPISQCCICWDSSIVVNYNGEVYNCPLSRKKIIDNINVGLKNIINNPSFVEYRQKIIEQSKHSMSIDSTCMINCPPGCRPHRGIKNEAK
jgi:MoaA/NifB/PqqE/SkfB family radical SAM enzyme